MFVILLNPCSSSKQENQQTLCNDVKKHFSFIFQKKVINDVI